MISVSVRWFGGVVSLDRPEACFAAHGIPAAGELIGATVALPWSAFIVAAIALHKEWIASQMGQDGVDLHMNWAGFVHWVAPRGDLRACEESTQRAMVMAGAASS